MVNFKIKCVNKDFIVNEVPFEPDLSKSSKSKFSYFWLEKNGLTTFEAEEKIRDFFNLSYEDIKVEGLKDEDAITSQMFSIKKRIFEKDLRRFNNLFAKKGKYLRMDRIIGYGSKPVAERFLHGNCFKVVVRNLSQKDAKTLKLFCGNRKSISFVNYYDSQRFGMAGGPYNSHVIGEKIINAKWAEALEEFSKTQNIIDLEKALDLSSDPIEVFKLINPSKLRFFVNSYNSFLWNRAASKQVSDLNKCVKCDFENVDLLNIPRKSSFLSQTRVAIEAFDYDSIKMKVSKKIKERSPLAQTTVYCSELFKDRIHKGKYSLHLSFFLPTGCYATMMVRQLVAWALKEENEKEC